MLPVALELLDPTRGRGDPRRRGGAGRPGACGCPVRSALHGHRCKSAPHRRRPASPWASGSLHRRGRATVVRGQGPSPAAAMTRPRSYSASRTWTPSSPCSKSLRLGAAAGEPGGDRHDASGIPPASPFGLGLRRGPQAHLPTRGRLPDADGSADEVGRRECFHPFLPPAAERLRSTGWPASTSRSTPCASRATSLRGSDPASAPPEAAQTPRSRLSWRYGRVEEGSHCRGYASAGRSGGTGRRSRLKIGLPKGNPSSNTRLRHQNGSNGS